jgi:hypothetical protein
MGMRHFTNTEEPITTFMGHASSANGADLYIGGGTSLGNAFQTLRFFTAANSTTVTGTERMRIDLSGNLGIGTASPIYSVDISRSGTGSAGAILAVSNHSSTLSTDRAILVLQRARGTASAPTIVSNGDQIGSFQANAYNGTGFNAIAGIDFEIDGTFTSGQRPPGRIKFTTTVANGSITERMRIDDEGNVGIGTTSPSTLLDVWGGLNVATSSTSLLRADTANIRVGIATSSPSHTLTVVGDMNLTGAFRSSGNAGTSGQILQSTGSGTTWVSTSTLGIQASLKPTVVVTSTTYTATSTQPTVLVDDDTAGAAVTVTLPLSSNVPNGTTFTILKMGTTGNVNIAIPTGDFLNGVEDGSEIITTQYRAGTVISTGGEWWITEAFTN